MLDIITADVAATANVPASRAARSARLAGEILA
jgi:hypothetical protein